MNLHTLAVRECVCLLHEIDREAYEALSTGLDSLIAFIEAVEPGFLAGGRLIYVGAGTSGRLGVLDAAEAVPTFDLEQGRIVGLIAGGDRALRHSSENAEDNPHGSVHELDALALTDRDAVLGIAAGGTTPYVLGALEYASGVHRLVRPTPARSGSRALRSARQAALHAAGRPLTALLVCAPVPAPPFVDHLIVLPTGPEALTGSTRLKAGTATKVALNIISTTLMVRAGRVYENLMVDLRATNAKLRDRAARIIAMLTGLDRHAAFELLDHAGGYVKTAILMHKAGLTRARASALLAHADNRLDRAFARLRSHSRETQTKTERLNCRL